MTTMKLLTMPVIFVAEDNEDLREYAVMLLTKAGYTVKAFEDGKLTLDAIKNSDVLPDLLLTDINMPNMNGHELVKALRSDTKFDNIKILIYSSDVSFGINTELDTTSLSKPAPANVLLSIIKGLLG